MSHCRRRGYWGHMDGVGGQHLAMTPHPILNAIGAEVLYSQLMSDLEPAERDFAADSWSLAVDSSFLQQHRKDVMKRQDVIYGERHAPCLCPPPAARVLASRGSFLQG